MITASEFIKWCQVFHVPFSGNPGNQVVVSWDGSTNPVDVIAGSGISITNGIVSTTSGPNPLVSGFSATLSSPLNNSTGDGTLVNVNCSNVNYNIGENYNSSTGIYTAPVDGIYSFGVSVFLGNITNVHTQYLFYLLVNGITYMMSQGNPANESSSNSHQITRRGILNVSLNAGQTVQMQVEVDGTSKTVTIGSGSQPTSFFGYFLGTDSGIIGVSSLNGLTGNVNLTSNDNTVTINNPSGLNIDFSVLSSINSQIVINSPSIGNMLFNTRYIISYGLGQTSGILPTSTGSGRIIEIVGLLSASSSGWRVNAQSTDKIQSGNSGSSLGGSLSSTSGYSTDCATFTDSIPGIWVSYPQNGLSLILS